MHLIHHAIQSVVDQTYPNWELIIIDDGSTDNTREVVTAYADERIQYHWQENQERSIARNNGFLFSSGDWICFLDSDDVYDKEYLSTLYHNITENDSIVRTRLSFVNEVGKTFFTTENYKGENQQTFVNQNIETLNNFSFRREVLSKYKIFDIPSWEDKDLFTRVLNEYRFKAIDYVSVVQLFHSERSINTFHRNSEIIPKVLERMKYTLSNAQYLTESEKRIIYDSYVYVLIHNAVNDPLSDGWAFMKKHGLLKLRYLIRWGYYTLKRALTNLAK